MDEKIFSLNEAREMLPWLREATREAERRIRRIQLEVQNAKDSRDKTRAIIHHWAETVLKLGALPKQPFTVDFNSGDDYFCWEYPEKDIFYRHGYNSGYAGRERIEDES